MCGDTADCYAQPPPEEIQTVPALPGGGRGRSQPPVPQRNKEQDVAAAAT